MEPGLSILLGRVCSEFLDIEVEKGFLKENV